MDQPRLNFLSTNEKIKNSYIKYENINLVGFLKYEKLKNSINCLIFNETYIFNVNYKKSLKCINKGVMVRLNFKVNFFFSNNKSFIISYF